MKEIIGLVAVRMASRRLPKKAFRTIAGKPILRILVDRLRTSGLDDFVVCTTTADEDKEIESWCSSNGVRCFRGDSDNVLRRFVRCVSTNPAAYIVRITGDNPFTDFLSMREMFVEMKQNKADYARQVGVPLGAACEIVRTSALEELHRRARTPELSEFMTYFFELAPFIRKQFFHVPENIRMPQLRLTIDYESDVQFANALVDHFHGRIPSLEEIVSHCVQRSDYPLVKEDAAASDEIKKKILID
ncbi:MAG: NTP transferase domain-containing protein [Elusimicrobia bacterium]|nr:NTP transferase domain-containing protein [Elusimicrobiota bacterium]